jgi:hypothetical protein
MRQEMTQNRLRNLQVQSKEGYVSYARDPCWSVPVSKEKPMRLKLAITLLFATASAPAFAHPEHDFKLPDFLHVVTEADHLAIAFVAVAAMAVIGRLAFRRLRK